MDHWLLGWKMTILVEVEVEVEVEVVGVELSDLGSHLWAEADQFQRKI